MRARHMLAAALALLPTIASASETVTYSYDAKGRLTNVAHSGSVNNGVVAAYTFDAADNRTSVSISGAMPQVIVVPLGGGLKVIPLSAS